MKWHLQWPFRSLVRAEIEEDDVWRTPLGPYVADYRSQIEEIAEKLGDMIGIPNLLSFRLNLGKAYVEIYFKKSGITFIRIDVYGNFGTPYEIVITTVYLLALEMKNIFCEVFGDKLSIKFIALL